MESDSPSLLYISIYKNNLHIKNLFNIFVV